MACPYYDKNTKTCRCSTQLVQVAQDRITQYCKGNYNKCPNKDSRNISYSWDERAANRQATARGNNIRAITPIAFVGVLLLCLLKFQFPLMQSIGAAVFVAIITLMFNNKYQ